MRDQKTIDSSHKPNMIIIGNGIWQIYVSEKNLTATQLFSKDQVKEADDFQTWIEVVGPYQYYGLYGKSCNTLTVEGIK